MSCRFSAVELGRMRFSRFVVLFLPLFPFDLKLTNQTNQKAPLGDNRILATSLFRDLLTPSLTDSTHSTGVDSALSLSEMRGRGAGSPFYVYMRVMGLLWERIDGLQEFWGVGRGWEERGGWCV